MGREPRECPKCKGTGEIQEYDPSDGTTDDVTCGRCNGTGSI
jgi:DnaJ-class molecular chaperone